MCPDIWGVRACVNLVLIYYGILEEMRGVQTLRQSRKKFSEWMIIRGLCALLNYRQYQGPGYHGRVGGGGDHQVPLPEALHCPHEGQLCSHAGQSPALQSRQWMVTRRVMRNISSSPLPLPHSLSTIFDFSVTALTHSHDTKNEWGQPALPILHLILVLNCDNYITSEL